MKVDLTVAGIDEAGRQGLQLAANLLGAYRWTARLRNWDGTRCDALIADTTDGHGRIAAESALRRGMRVLHFGQHPATAPAALPHIASVAPVAVIAQQLRELLGPTPPAESKAATEPLVVRLANDSFGFQQDLMLRSEARAVLLRRSVSRVSAPSLSDLVYCRDHLDTEPWQIEQLIAGTALPADHDYSMSLDSFLLQVTSTTQLAYPAFPGGRWRLQDWPDLGAAVNQVAALRVVRSLRREPASAQEIARNGALAPELVDRTLWAFRASGILQQVSDSSETIHRAPVATSAAPASNSILARLARRFHLTW